MPPARCGSNGTARSSVPAGRPARAAAGFVVHSSTATAAAWSPGVGDSRSARPSHPALGGRRPHGAVQPRAGLPVSPPAAPSGPHHHHRTRPSPRGHRRRRHTTQFRIARPPSHPTPTRGRTLPRTHRRTRRLVVVPTLPTTTTTVEQLTARIINSPRVVRLIGCLNLDPQVLTIH